MCRSFVFRINQGAGLKTTTEWKRICGQAERDDSELMVVGCDTRSGLRARGGVGKLRRCNHATLTFTHPKTAPALIEAPNAANQIRLLTPSGVYVGDHACSRRHCSRFDARGRFHPEVP